MNPLKLLVALTLALIFRDLIRYFILDKMKEFEQLRGSIASTITVHKEFIFPTSAERVVGVNVDNSKKALIKIAGEIDRFASIRNPFLFLLPNSVELKDAAYCFLSIARQNGNNGMLMKKIERVFKLGPFQINPHNSTNHKNTQMTVKKRQK